MQDLVAHVTEPELLQLFESLPETPPSASTDPDAALMMYNLLNTLDPVMAARWHWRDTRKVLRSLEIVKETGRKASDIVAEQASRNAVNEPRFVHSQKSIRIVADTRKPDSGRSSFGYMRSQVSWRGGYTSAWTR